METEIKDYKQSRSANEENTLKRDSITKKLKRKERRKLLESLIEVYEKEKASKLLNEQPEPGKALPFQETNTDLLYHSRTTPKQPKTKRSKKTVAKHFFDLKTNQAFTDDVKIKCRQKPCKYKPGSRQCEVMDKFHKEEEQITPVVVLHHRGEKPFEKSKEHLHVLSKNLAAHRIKSSRRSKMKNTTEIEDHSKVNCDEVCHGADFNTRKPVKEKTKSRLTNGELCEIENFRFGQKVETKKQNRCIEKSIPVHNNSSSLNGNIINQINSIPIRIEDRPLSFMKLFRIASVFQGYKDKKKYEDFIKLYCEKSKQDKEQVNSNLKADSKKYSKNLVDAESLRKIRVDERHSSKRLKGLKSRKSIRKHKNKSIMISSISKQCSIVNLENIPKSLNSVKSRKVLKKRRIKNVPFDRLSVSTNQKHRFESFLSKEKANLLQSVYQNYRNDIKLRNKFCGDGGAGDMSSKSSSQNKKLSTIFSESFATNGIAEKESSAVNQLLNDSKHERNNDKYFSKTSKSTKNNEYNKCDDEQNIVETKKVGKISIVKPTLSEDGKKITFQVVKSQFSSKNVDKLNKHLFKLNNKHLVNASKENLSMEEDRLMLFYATRDSTCPSQDSSNIAISKGTGTSNNGGSESVLKVVIKQTKSLLSSTKSQPLTDGDLGTYESKERDIVENHNVKVSNQGREVNVFEKVGVGLRKQNFFDILQSKYITTNSDNQEPDSQQPIREETDCQQKPLSMNTFNGLFSFKIDPQAIPRKPIQKQASAEGLGVSAEANVGSKLSRNSVSIPAQKTYIKCAQHRKGPHISPKRNPFQPFPSPHSEVQTVERSAEQEKLIHEDCSNNISQQDVDDLDILQLKLQQIGLTQRKSFVKVIEAENEENASKLRQKDLYSFENNRQSKTENTNKFFLPTFAEKDNKKHYLPTAKNNSLQNSRTYNKIKCEDSKTEEILGKCFKNDLIKGFSSAKPTYNDVVYKGKVLTKEVHHHDGFCEGEDVKTKRENFVTILPKATINPKKTLKPTKETNVHPQDKVTGEKKEETSFSDTGVQTDIPLHQTLEKTETQTTYDCLNLSNTSENKNCKITNDSDNKLLLQTSDKHNGKISHPEKNNSFVRVFQSCISEMPNIKGNNLDCKEIGCLSVKEPVWNSSHENDDTVGSLIKKKDQHEEQIVIKINAIYDFLQYLDTVLKGTAITKSKDFCKTSCSKIGNFNKTLRCLCSNCIELLHRFDMKQTVEHKPSKHLNSIKSPERNFSDFASKRSLFVSEVSSQKERDCRTNDSSIFNNNNFSRVGKPNKYSLGRDCFQSQLDNNWNPEPFIVVVPSNEHFDKRFIQQDIKRDTQHSLKQMNSHKETEHHKQVLKSHDHYLRMVDEFDDSLLRKKIENCSRLKHEINDSGRFKTTSRRKPADQQDKSDKVLKNKVKNCSASASGMIVQRKNIYKGNATKEIDTNELSNKGKARVSSVRSDLSLEKSLRRTGKYYLPEKGNKQKKQDYPIFESRGFGDSLLFVEREGNNCQSNIDEKSFVARKSNTNTTIKSISYNSFTNERHADQRSSKREKYTSTNTRQFLSENISCSSSPNRKTTKNDSTRQSIVKKMCSSGKRVLKNLEKNLVKSVSINRLHLRQNSVLKSNTSSYNRLRDKSSKISVREQTNLKNVKEEETICCRDNLHAIRNDSNSSINSYVLTDGFGKIKNTTFLKHTNEESAVSEGIKTNFSKYNKAYQGSQAIAQSINKSNLKNIDNRLSSIKSVTSISSIDSSFSQNNKTLVFTNTRLSCSTALDQSIESCHFLREEQRNSQMEEEITNKSSVCDSTGWISISSCDLLSKNGEINTNNRSSLSSNDLEKVRLQMDLNLNNVMHVEFYCHPSDSIDLAKNKNSLK